MNNRPGILDQFKDAFRRPNNAYIQLILINVAIFLLLDGVMGITLSLAGQGEIYDTFKSWFVLPANFTDDGTGPFLFRQPWTLFTYMFLHGGIWHIAGNMLFLFFFGRLVQEYLGSQKVISLYVLGGLVGGLLFLVLYNVAPVFEGSRAYLLGASAGVFAIVVGAATLLPDHVFHLIFLGPVKIKYIAIVYVIFFFFGLVGSNAGGDAAHIGGALMGFLYIRQLQQGRDYGTWVIRAMEWFKNLFRPKPKIRVTYRNPNPSSSRSTQKTRTTKRSSSSSTSRSSSRPAPNKGSGDDNISQEEIDAILDKIADRGYDSLSKEEKQKLFNASNQG
ncbi:MAG TPA: rhomboid family intramembrane serine protease [Cytophagales bacterium]|nr:rhomboid family intramembrane serine protease [Cytophagales bacterium]HAA18296.1 rhomboid family intramembrane serine protease [Cytophagales bacterium]HAP63883.1 rhomboid family intramembrane serine protease [Cytophagales bacterium]